MAFAACTKEPGPADSGEITIEASVGAMTKVSYDGHKTSFTAGDQVLVYGWLGSAAKVPEDCLVDGVVNTLGTDGKWTPESPMLWKPGGEAHYFLSVYPVRDITSFLADDFTLNPADYTESDLLIATNMGGVTASQGPVELEFTHAMAKLVVNLKFRNAFGGTPTVKKVTVNARTEATLNYLSKAVTAKGDASEVALTAAASVPAGYEVSFSGIQVPQEGVRRVTLTVNTDEYEYESVTDIPLTPGKYTSLNLIVGKDKIELSGVTVSDWTSGADLPDGEAVLSNPPVNPPAPDNEPIAFADSGLKQYLLDNPKVNLNHDNEISKAEAAAVTSLVTLFDTGATEGRDYTQFNEFQYFTGITTLPAKSFNNWTSLTAITLPESIVTIDVDFDDKPQEHSDITIFRNCPKLVSIKGKFTVNDNALVYNTTLVKVAESLTSYTMPEGIEKIGRYCFYNSRVKSVDFCSTLRVIGESAFEYSDIETVDFKGVVEQVYNRSFAHCFKLKSFTGASKPSLWVEGNGSTLIADIEYLIYKSAQPPVLLENAKITVAAYAHAHTGSKLIIPDDRGIKRISDCVFDMSDMNGNPTSPVPSYLETIALPTGINTIGERSFCNLTTLQRLYFHGPTTPAICGSHALDNTTMIIYVPDGADLDGFAKVLNVPSDHLNTWTFWDP